MQFVILFGLYFDIGLNYNSYRCWIIDYINKLDKILENMIILIPSQVHKKNYFYYFSYNNIADILLSYIPTLYLIYIYIIYDICKQI